MDNNLISNPKAEVPSGISFNDKDFITSLLNCLKNMEKNYAIVLMEASNEVLYQKYYDMFFRLAQLQRDVYELMFSFGWYTLEKLLVIKSIQNIKC